MRRRAFLTTAVGAAAALAGCSSGTGRELPSTPDGDWTHHAHDARNSGAAAVGVPSRGTPAWDRGAASGATPLIDGDTVYAVADDATALDARTGEVLWEAELPAIAEWTPVLTDDLLVVAAADRLLALGRPEGEQRWGVDLPWPAGAALTVDPATGTVTVPLAGRRGGAGLVAYDTSGERLWTDGTLSPRTAAVDGDAVYVTGYRQNGNTGVLRRLSVTDGSRRWERELASPDTAPVIADAGLLVGDGGTLALHERTNGERARTLGTFGDRLPEPPAVADGTAFVTSNGGDLVAVDVDDGTERWRRGVGVVASTGVSVGRDAVVASVSDLPAGSLAGVAAYERADGSARWAHEIEGFDAYPSTAPVLAEGGVFYTSNESDGVVALGDLPARETA